MFVCWLGNHPRYVQTAKKWIKEIEGSQRGDFITSTLSIYETLVVLAGLAGKNPKDKHFINQIVSAFNSIKPLRIEPLKIEDYRKAADLMNECELDFEDSLHLAVAMRTKVQEIVSNDKDFDAAQIRRVF